MERLEDEPDPVASHRRQLPLRRLVQPDPAELDQAGVDAVERADHVQERGFPGA
jgi:hypothetical protein